MRFYIQTFGCRVNFAESTKLALELKNLGYRDSSHQKAEIVIVNACAVTQKAMRTTTRFLNFVKASNPKAQIWLTGCGATFLQKKNQKPKQVDYLISNEQKPYLSSLIVKTTKFIGRKEDKPVWGKFLQSSRLMIKVQDGCNYFCTYCIVPYLRGLSRSIEPQTVINYWKKISSQTKVNELILTGINLGLYETKDKSDFTSLVEKVLRQTTVPKISFGSLYTANLTEGFFNLYQSGESQRLTRYLHIPIQSGSDKILSLMRRHYNLSEFDERLQALHKSVPDALLATDIIVGFCGETDADFEETYQYLKSSPFVKAHVFKFSLREFTKAYYLAKKLPEPNPAVKDRRSKAIRNLFKQKLNVYLEKIVGQKQRALIINSNSKYSLGFLNNGLEIILPDNSLGIGWVNVKIEVSRQGKLIGKLI
jgi:threonylcarbamoyladenosine tRNA methylthiotransferase MtaB